MSRGGDLSSLQGAALEGLAPGDRSVGLASTADNPDQKLRRLDEDRWLASRFAPRPERDWLVALAALAHEFSRIPQSVSQPPAAAIRLRWWLEQIELMQAGGAPAPHPLTAALREPLASGRLPLEPFGQMADARLLDYEAEPFESWLELEAYLDHTSGALMHLSALACWPAGPWPPGYHGALRNAARAWGLTELLRALPQWTARQRLLFPRKLMQRVGLSAEEAFAAKPGHAFNAALGAMRERAMSCYKEARDAAPQLPPSLFPALAYVALTPTYHRAMQRQNAQSRPDGRAPLLSRQVRLVAAAASGRI